MSGETLLSDGIERKTKTGKQLKRPCGALVFYRSAKRNLTHRQLFIYRASQRAIHPPGPAPLHNQHEAHQDVT